MINSRNCFIFVVAFLIRQVETRIQSVGSAGACPTICDCKPPATIGCQVCLGINYRSYSIKDNKCPCIDGFTEQEVPSSYCCPKNCIKCSASGNCVQCALTWTPQLSAFGVTVCVCRPNFYYDSTDCRCMSRIEPTKYYSVESEVLCFACPIGCVCSQLGCISCEPWTHRIVTTVKINPTTITHHCRCLPPYELSDNACACPDNCTCIKGILSCNVTANRFITALGIYQCRSPWLEVGNVCVCQKPFTIGSTGDCVCSSYTNTSAAYINKEGECVSCPENCVCDNIGCIACGSYTHRVIEGNSCPCQQPFREIMGMCECFTPYYYNETQEQCVCMSEVYPSRYYIDKTGNGLDKCQKCPSGCNCSVQRGCYSCVTAALRRIFMQGSYSICVSCVDYAINFNGECKCRDGSPPTADGKCDCSTGLLFYKDATAQRCARCPSMCKCDEKQGCYFCLDGSFRNVTLDPNTNLYTCRCFANARIGDIDENCYCSQTIDPVNSSQCTCPSPYFTDFNGVCTCMSNKFPEHYYYDYLNDACSACPVGCTCDEFGCSQCTPNLLRYVYIYFNNYFQCSCLQIAQYQNGSCMACGANEHYFNGECIRCVSCQTCDWTGACLSCKSDMNLINGSCACTNSFLVNVNGSCRCQIGFFLNNKGVCTPCAVECLDCQIVGGNITPTCLACAVGMKRFNDPTNNCPCVDGYAENPGGTRPYCCDRRCGTCNETGCTSCQADMNRRLSGKQECLCIGNLVELNTSMVCGCSDGDYLYINVCQPCPIQCQRCFYNSTINSVQCLSCEEHTNRNDSADYTGVIHCNCLQTFQESHPQQEFCYPEFCMQPEIPCTACSDNRTPSADGLKCYCRNGFFEDAFGYCAPCLMSGCISCSALNQCNECDEQKGYYLTLLTCKSQLGTNKYLYAQSNEFIVVQFSNELVDTGVYTHLNNVTASIEHIRGPVDNNSLYMDVIPLSVLWFLYTSNNTVSVALGHPLVTVTNVILAIRYTFTKSIAVVGGTWYGVNDNGTFAASDAEVFIKLPIVYSAAMISRKNNRANIATLILCVVVWLVCITVYLRGFKHNQTIWFLQTMSFLGFVIVDEELTRSMFLYSLHACYLNFKNALVKIIPADYFQSSPGNFWYLTYDSNFFRVVGTQILVALIVASLSIIFRVTYFVCSCTKLNQNPRAISLVKTKKKLVYRLLEFHYKMCMYPIIFFSFVSFKNWNAMVLTKHTNYHNFCHGVALAFFFSYLFVTIYQIWWESIAKVNRIENAFEFGCDCLAALILCLSMHRKTYLLIIMLTVFRGSTYVMLRRVILRDFRKLEYIKLFSAVLELAAIVSTTGSSKGLIAFFIILTVVTQLCHASVVVFQTSTRAFFNKKETSSIADTHDNFPTTEANLTGMASR